MNSLDVLLLIAVGRLLIYLWMQFPMPSWFENSRYGKLHHCILCSGVWIYSGLFLIYDVDLLSMVGLIKVQGGQIIGGGIISYFMWLLEIGFKEQFMSFVIE